MTHAPSQARAVVAAAKAGGDAATLLEDARAIADPQHAAWALVNLSTLPAVPSPEAQAAAQDAFRLALAVEEAWRRGELVEELARRTADWRPGDPAAAKLRPRLPTLLLDVVRSLPPGEGLSRAVQATAGRLDRPHLLPLLDLALAGGAEEAKRVLAAWAKAAPAATGEETRALLATLARVADPLLRSRLLAHLHLQSVRAGLALPEDVLGAAWDAAAEAGQPLDGLRHVVGAAGDLQSLEPLAERARALPPELSCRVLAAAGAEADKQGIPGRAADWLREAAQASSNVQDEAARRSAQRNIAQGLARLGLDGEAAALAPAAAPRPGPKAAPEAPAPSMSPDRPAPSPPRSMESTGVAGRAPHGTRPTLALHNGYDGGLDRPHLQAIARAAPLALAFGLDLALVGFPVDDLKELAAAVGKATRIGEGLPIAGELVRAGRIRLVPRSLHARPDSWGVPGTVVATTQRPDPAKAATWESLRPLAPLCVVMGLGHRGLPPQLLQACPHHLELTGRNVPLETATAMGIVASRLGSPA